ncbi:WD40 domain-containing protein [Kamptonema formosum]|uniref:WD40 domain-containing protein n=1 Tax=Kamptonema formosum TaxID=331992 RepID=UPI00034A6E6A|nr:NB-ARC domain-containing protein [Oscillatoria sp. PCC 10802]
MSQKSIRVRRECVKQVKSALVRQGYAKQEALAEHAQLGLATVGNFLNGKPVSRENFFELCRLLGLEWLDVAADLEDDAAHKPSSKPPNTPNTHRDWGDAPDVSLFFGRTDCLDTLEQWIVRDKCRLVALLGIGGIGKTALSVKLADRIESEFQYLIWRSLRNAPPVQDILAVLIQFLKSQIPPNSPEVRRGEREDLPDTAEDRISLLIDYLRRHRCLLVLDNAESILLGGDSAGQYRQGYEKYGELFRRVGETPHRSCLLLTSREKPRELTAQEGETLPVRSRYLPGLSESEGQPILQAKGLDFRGDRAASSESGRFGVSPSQELIHRCGGNPLFLKIVATTIKEVYDGNIAEFLSQNTLAFAGIRFLLDEHYNRLSALEKQVMYWLAIEREPVATQHLREDIIPRVAQAKLVEALKSLAHRSLIERSAGRFTLQPAVMEYMTERLIDKCCQEIEAGEIALFQRYALIKATAKDYVREAQTRVILQPVAERLLAGFGSKAGVGCQLKQILSGLRENPKPGYAGGNALNLLCQMQVDLTSADFSNLPVWQAFLRGVNLQGVNFAGADLENSVFTETFAIIFYVAFSPCGKLLAAGDYEGGIHLWRVADGQKLFTLKGHTSTVNSVAFSPDGRTLASGSDDETVRLWNVCERRCVRILQEHRNWVNSVAFSPDGLTLASCSEDKTVKLWDAVTGECRKTLQGDTDRVYAVAFSLDSKTLATGSRDSSVRLWDVGEGKCLAVLLGHTDTVRAVAFSPDGQTLASGSDDKTVKLWDIRDAGSSQCLTTLQEHSNQVRSVAFSPDGQTLASGSFDQTVKLWDIRDARNCRAATTLRGHTAWIRSAAFSPDGKTLASGGYDQTVRLWDVGDVSQSECLATWRGHTNWIYSVAFSPQGNILASGSADRAIRLWDVNNGQCLTALLGHRELVSTIAFSPEGKTVATSSDDTNVKLWDVSSGECLATLQGHRHWVYSVAFSPDGRTLASGSDDLTVKLWDVRTRECRATLQEHTERVFSVAFSPQGKIIASGSRDRTVKLWDAGTGQCLATLHGHEREINSVAFSPDGQLLASASDDKTVRLWDVGTHECLAILQGHDNWVHSVAFSPQGHILASGSIDKTVRLWDVRTHECLAILQGHDHWVPSVAFSPDSSILATGSGDETIKLWDVKTGTLLKTMRAPRPCEGMNITGAAGLTEAQKATLKVLGAVEYGG